MWDGVLVLEFVAGRQGLARPPAIQGAHLSEDGRERLGVHCNSGPHIGCPLTFGGLVEGEHHLGLLALDHKEGQHGPQQSPRVDGVKAPAPSRAAALVCAPVPIL